MGRESFILSVRRKEAQEPPELGEEGEKALICPFTILTGLYRALAVCQAPRQVLGMPRGQGRGSRMNRSVLPRRCPAVACGSRRGRPGSRPWPQRADTAAAVAGAEPAPCASGVLSGWRGGGGGTALQTRRFSSSRLKIQSDLFIDRLLSGDLSA